MARWYRFFRWLGYGAGIAGIVLLIAGRLGGEAWAKLQLAGAFCVLLMFFAFMATYIIFMISRLRRR